MQRESLFLSYHRVEERYGRENTIEHGKTAAQCPHKSNLAYTVFVYQVQKHGGI